MAPLPKWAGSKTGRPQVKGSVGQSAYEFTKAVYKETNGATPALRDLVRSYKSGKASGAIRTEAHHCDVKKR